MHTFAGDPRLQSGQISDYFDINKIYMYLSSSHSSSSVPTLTLDRLLTFLMAFSAFSRLKSLIFSKF